MTKQERENIARSGIIKLLGDANINLTVDEFIQVYSSNKGIKNNVVNVWKNIQKYQLNLEGNFKYLFKILNDSNFLNNIGDFFKR